MFDIGFWELLLVGVIGLLVLGPERLPVAIRTVSRWIRAVRSTADGIKQELSQELKLQELHDNLKKAEKQGMKDLAPSLQESVDKLKQAADEVKRPYRKETTSSSKETTSSSPDNRNEP